MRSLVFTLQPFVKEKGCTLYIEVKLYSFLIMGDKYYQSARYIFVCFYRGILKL